MSKISIISHSLDQLPNVLATYEAELIQAEERLGITGRTLEQALKDQIGWPAYYDSKRAEVKSLVEYMDSQVARVRGKLVKKYKENHSRDLGERQLNSYIDQEQEYLSMKILSLEVQEVMDKFDAVRDAFTKRGFALRDITQARIHSIYDTAL